MQLKRCLVFVLATLALAGASLALAQGPTPLPVPQLACAAPIFGLAVGSHGVLLRICDFGGDPSGTVFGRFAPGQVIDMVRPADGSVVLLTYDHIVRMRFGDGESQWFPVSGATAFLQATYNGVAVLREQQGQVWEYNLYGDGSLFARPAWQERRFASRCTQVIQMKSGDLVCVDRYDGRISRAGASLFRPARPDELQPYTQIEGVEYAREYRGGLLVLTRPEWKCPDPSPVPPNATFCYTEGSCRRVKEAQLLYVTGGDKPAVRQLPFKLSATYGATFSVVGDTAYLVETDFGPQDNWLGDYISKINLVTGQKSVYLSRAELSQWLGPEPADMVIN